MRRIAESWWNVGGSESGREQLKGEEREREREMTRLRGGDDRGGRVLYVETLIGVTCSETSYRRVALIFRGSYVPVEKDEGGARGMCGGWYTLDAAVDAPVDSHVVFHAIVAVVSRARMLREFVSPADSMQLARV